MAVSKYGGFADGLLAGFNTMEARSGRLADQEAKDRQLAISEKSLAETMRQNKAQEQFKLDQLDETSRHNLAQEALGRQRADSTQDYYDAQKERLAFMTERGKKEDERKAMELRHKQAAAMAPMIYGGLESGDMNLTSEQYRKFADLAKGGMFDPELLLNSEYRQALKDFEAYVQSEEFSMDDPRLTQFGNRIWGHLLGEGKSFNKFYVTDDGRFVADLNVMGKDGPEVQPMTIHRSSSPLDTVRQSDPRMWLRDAAMRAAAARRVEQNKAFGGRLSDLYNRDKYDAETQAQVMAQMDKIQTNYEYRKDKVAKPYRAALEDVGERLKVTTDKKEREQLLAYQQQIGKAFDQALTPLKQQAERDELGLLSEHSWMYNKGLLSSRYSKGLPANQSAANPELEQRQQVTVPAPEDQNTGEQLPPDSKATPDGKANPEQTPLTPEEMAFFQQRTTSPFMQAAKGVATYYPKQLWQGIKMGANFLGSNAPDKYNRTTGTGLAIADEMAVAGQYEDALEAYQNAKTQAEKDRAAARLRVLARQNKTAIPQ